MEGGVLTAGPRGKVQAATRSQLSCFGANGQGCAWSCNVSSKQGRFHAPNADTWFISSAYQCVCLSATLKEVLEQILVFLWRTEDGCLIRSIYNWANWTILLVALSAAWGTFVCDCNSDEKAVEVNKPVWSSAFESPAILHLHNASEALTRDGWMSIHRGQPGPGTDLWCLVHVFVKKLSEWEYWCQADHSYRWYQAGADAQHYKQNNQPNISVKLKT